MLKLLAMLTAGKFLFSLFLLSTFLMPAISTGNVFIDSPVENGYLQGAVTVMGGMDVKDFLSYEVSFTYDEDKPNPTWFLITKANNQVQKGTLATWDTSTITDGDYRLKVMVQLIDGQQISKIVNHLHVSNYSPVGNNGSILSATQAIPVKSAPTVQAVLPVPVDLPANPVELTRADLWTNFTRGIIYAILVFAALGIYLGLRKFSGPK